MAAKKKKEEKRWKSILLRLSSIFQQFKEQKEQNIVFAENWQEMKKKSFPKFGIGEQSTYKCFFFLMDEKWVKKMSTNELVTKWLVDGCMREKKLKKK